MTGVNPDGAENGYMYRIGLDGLPALTAVEAGHELGALPDMRELSAFIDIVSYHAIQTQGEAGLRPNQGA